MEPEAVRAWLRIFRDFAIITIASFIFVHETIAEGSPDPTLIGAALVLFGIPAALRVDQYIQRKDKDDGE